MTTDRIDIHRYGGKLQHELSRLPTDERILIEHRRTIARFVSEARAGRTVRRGAKKRISEGRCLKYLYFLRRFAMELNVPFESVTVADMERFVLGIEDGQITKLIARGDSPAYSHETVLDYKKLLRKFYRWLLGHDTARFHELTGWFDTSDRVTEPVTFGLGEARQMAEGIESIQGAALIMTLFDGGFRPGELFNIRLRDITVQAEDGEPTVYARVRHSKTMPRTISLPLATPFVLRWIGRHPGGGSIDAQGVLRIAKPDALLFTWSYAYCRNVIRRVGQQELGERVFLYRFRHASATFYARHLTEYQMCARYGWVMGSKSVRRYINSAGLLATGTVAAVRDAARAANSGPTAIGQVAAPSIQTRAGSVSARPKRLAVAWRQQLAQRADRPHA